MKLAFLAFAVCFCHMVKASPTAYLPIGADAHLQLQINRLFSLTSGNPMRLPYAIKDIEIALGEIKQSKPVLYQSIKNQLDRYRGRQKLSRIGIVTRATRENDHSIANQRGLTSGEPAQLVLEGIWRPNSFVLFQAGMDYRVNSGDLVPFNSFIAVSRGKLQLDMGYKEHWYSPFKFSSQLISSNAKMGPSVSLSTTESFEKWWRLKFDLFYTRLDKVKQGIKYMGDWHDGSPHLLGTHVSIEPMEGWKLGFNRLLQFAGGPRKVSMGDILKAFIDPATNDNSYTLEERKSEFGDQMASITSSYQFKIGLPVEVYAELAGEDTQGESNFSLGNQATSLGIFLPQINKNIDLRYEYNRFKTSWYTNHMYAYGNTNGGHVIGHYAADQRRFGHGVPAEIHRASIDFFTSMEASWGLSLASINNKDRSLYTKGHEVELQRRHNWRSSRVESRLILGESVFSKNYLHLSTGFFW